MRKLLPAALAFAVMLAPLSPVMAEDFGVGVGPGGIGVHVGDQDHGDRHNGDRNRAREHRTVAVDHDRDYDRGCRVVITKYHHDGMTTTRRERKCD